MPFIPTANTVRCEVRFDQDGQPTENVLYFRKTSAVTVSDVQTLAEDLLAYWIANQGVQQSSQLEIREVYALDPTVAASWEWTATPASPTFGGYASNAAPNNVSLAIKFTTGFSGRSKRGRNYFAGLVKAEIVENTINAAYIDAIVDAYDGMTVPAAVSPNFLWVVASFKTGGAWRTAGATFAVTDASVSDNIVDSQRGRLPGR